MNNQFDNLQNLKQDLRLTPEERASLRVSLLAAMRQEESVRTKNASRQLLPERSLLNRLFNPLLVTLRSPMPIALVVIVIALATGSGVSLAAEQSLPGEALYSVKVTVNEKLQTAVAFSTQAKANLEAKLANRRLTEAEKLAVNTELGKEARVQVQDNFEKHTDRVQAHIEALALKGQVATAAEVSSNLEGSLKAHENILSKLAEKNNKEITILLVQVKTDREEAASARLRFEAELNKKDEAAKQQEENRAAVSAQMQAEVKTAAEGRLEAATNKIAEVKAFLEKNKANLKAEAVLKAEAQVKAAEQTLAAGKANLEAEAFGEAFTLFQQAHRAAQEAKLIIQANKELNLEVNGTTKIETETKIELKKEMPKVEIKGGLKTDLDLY